MSNVLTSVMGIIFALCLALATLTYGAASFRWAAPIYGCALLLALIWIARLVTSPSVTWQKSPMHWPVAGFLIYSIVRYVMSPIEYDSRLELINVCFYTFIYFTAALNFHHPRHRTVLLLVLGALAFLESTYGLWQFATKAQTVLFENRPVKYHHRASGTFICPNHLAGFLEVILGLLLARLAIYRSTKDSVQKSVLQRVVLIYAVLTVMSGIIVSLSRAGWIAATAGLLSFIFWGELRPRTLALRALIVALGIGLFTLIAFNVTPVRDYVSLTFMGTDESKPMDLKDPGLGGRKEMWGATLQMIRDHPVLGTGPGTWQWVHLQYRDPRMVMRPEYPHSDVLNLASDYGLVGVALVLAILACFYWHVLRLAGPHNTPEQRAFAVGSGMGITALLVHSWFDFNMHIPANALLAVTVMGVTVAAEEGEGRFARVEMHSALKYLLAVGLFLFCLFGGWLVGTTFLAERDNYKGKNAHRLPIFFDHALSHYQRAIATDPRFPEPHEKIGDIYRVQSMYQIGPERQARRGELARRAIQSYRRGLELNPYNSNVMLKLARAQELAGDTDVALKTYQRALKIDPNNSFLHRRLALFYRNQAEEAAKQGMEDQAKEFKTRAKEHFEREKQLIWWLDHTAPMNLEELRDIPDPAP